MKGEGVKLPPPQNKLPSKIPALLGLRQPGFANSACGPFTRVLKRIHKFKETGGLT